MSDPNWKAPEPGDPGTPRDVNREGDVVWDGTDPEGQAGQARETQPAKKAAKKTAAKTTDSESGQG